MVYLYKGFIQEFQEKFISINHIITIYGEIQETAQNEFIDSVMSYLNYVNVQILNINIDSYINTGTLILDYHPLLKKQNIK